MTKIKLSPVEKHLIRDFVIAILVQIAIVLFFVSAHKGSIPVDLSETETFEVTVDNLWSMKFRRGNRAYYMNDIGGTTYRFLEYHTEDQPQNWELQKMLSYGDRLTVTCYKTFVPI